MDVSPTCIGAFLSQEDGDGLMKAVYYLSRKLAKPEKNYSTTERELLGLVVALKKFRHLIQGQAIKIMTDHRPLLWLVKQDQLSGRLARWTTLISEYAVENSHVTGKLNTVAEDCQDQ